MLLENKEKIEKVYIKMYNWGRIYVQWGLSPLHIFKV